MRITCCFSFKLNFAQGAHWNPPFSSLFVTSVASVKQGEQMPWLRPVPLNLMVQVSHCVIITATPDEDAAASTVPQCAQSVAGEDGIAMAWMRNNLSMV